LITSTVTESDLASLSAYDLGKLEERPELERRPYQDTRQTEAPLPETIDLTVPVSEQYQQTIELLRNYLDEEKIENLQILINEGTEIRASGLRNVIRDELPLPIFISEYVITDEDTLLYQTPADDVILQAVETVQRLDPEVARIRPIFTAPININSWTLRFFDQEDREINQITGTGSVPEYIDWDWLDSNGEIINPGLYYYNLSWVTSDGLQETSRSRNLYVQKIERNIMIDITKDIERILEDPDQINVILKNN